MLTPLYFVLAVVVYAILADRTDRAIEREMQERRPGGEVNLVEDFDARPALGPRHSRLRHRHARPSSRDADRGPSLTM